MKTAPFAILSLLALAGCSTPTPPPDIQASGNPANPSLGVSTPARTNIIQGYADRTPLEPQGWDGPADKAPEGGSGS